MGKNIREIWKLAVIIVKRVNSFGLMKSPLCSPKNLNLMGKIGRKRVNYILFCTCVVKTTRLEYKYSFVGRSDERPSLEYGFSISSGQKCVDRADRPRGIAIGVQKPPAK